MRIEAWLQTHTRSLSGTRVAVTGSTGGIGRELCRELCRLGASLILLNRSVERAERQWAELRALCPDAEILCLPLDLESIESAEQAVSQLIQAQIDVFVHNAGAYSIPRRVCACGYDNVFTINFAAPYYMIRRLLPSMRERGGRIAVVGSIAHRYSKTDPRDVDFRHTKSAARVYGNAKRYLMLSLPTLLQDEPSVSLAVTHPGITFTNITAHYPKLIFAIIKHPMKLIFMSPRRAACSVLLGVLKPTAPDEWIGPRFFDVWGLPKKKKLHCGTDDERRQIAETAERVFADCQASLSQARRTV